MVKRYEYTTIPAIVEAFKGSEKERLEAEGWAHYKNGTSRESGMVFLCFRREKAKRWLKEKKLL